MKPQHTRKEMVEMTLKVYVTTKDKEITINIMHKLFGNYYFSVISNSIDMFKSLAESIELAGGSDYIYDKWNTISLVDIIEKLCTNRIRFTVIGKTKNEKMS